MQIVGFLMRWLNYVISVYQVHKIIGFAPILLQVVMEENIDMPVRQAGKLRETILNLPFI